VEKRFEARRWSASLDLSAARDDSTPGVFGVSGGGVDTSTASGDGLGVASAISMEGVGRSDREYRFISGGAVTFDKAGDRSGFGGSCRGRTTSMTSVSVKGRETCARLDGCRDGLCRGWGASPSSGPEEAVREEEAVLLRREEGERGSPGRTLVTSWGTGGMGMSEGATGGTKPPIQRSLSETFPALLVLDPEGSDRLVRAEGFLEDSAPGVIRPDRDEPFALVKRVSSTSEELTTCSPRRDEVESVLVSPLLRVDRSVALAL
jgi:hypothetical protein